MKLVDMKLDKEEKKKQAEPTKVSETSEYPYDLRFTLNENSLKKLGFGPKDFHGKKTVEMNAVADVGVIREIINPKYTWE